MKFVDEKCFTKLLLVLVRETYFTYQSSDNDVDQFYWLSFQAHNSIYQMKSLVFVSEKRNASILLDLDRKLAQLFFWQHQNLFKVW